MADEAVEDAVVALVAADDAGWETLRGAADTLDSFGVRWEKRVTATTGAVGRGVKAVVAASPDGGLPGRWAAATGRMTIRVPVEGRGRAGMALLQDDEGELPAGPEDGAFATMAIGAAGAKNAALFVVAALAVTDEGLRRQWVEFRERQTQAVLDGAGPVLAD